MSARRMAMALLLFAFTASSQEITPADRQRLSEIVPHLLETLYVLPDKGNELAAQMRASFAGGKYDAAKTAPALAEAITRDLAAANDRHLKMIFTPATAAEPVLTLDAWKARRAAMAGGGGRGPRVDRDALRRANYGVQAAEVLDGNIGYLQLREFTAAPETRAVIDGAMAVLANTDAMIVDVRNCPGGNGDTVAYLASYFFGPEPRVLMRRHHRPSNSSRDTAVMEVSGRRRPEVPLFVLTGPRSASACESFAFQLQQWGRAKTVGGKTAGAGYNNMLIDLGRGLRFSISIGTAAHAKTGKSFEAVGVQPDIAAPVETALEAARSEALRALGRGDAVAEVRQVEREWLDAYENHDAEAMNRVVGDDFVLVYPDGRKQTKADLLAMLAKPRPANMPAPKFTTDEVQGRVEGDRVVLTGRVTMRMGSRSRASRYRDTYARRDGRWQVVASELKDDATSAAAADVPFKPED